MIGQYYQYRLKKEKQNQEHEEFTMNTDSEDIDWEDILQEYDHQKEKENQWSQQNEWDR